MQQSGPDHTDPFAEQCAVYATLVVDPILRNFKVKREKPRRRSTSCPPRVVSPNSPTPTSLVVPPCSAQVSTTIPPVWPLIVIGYVPVFPSEQHHHNVGSDPAFINHSVEQSQLWHCDRQSICKSYKDFLESEERAQQQQNARVAVPHRKSQRGGHQVNRKKEQRKTPLPDEHLARKAVDACKDHQKNAQREIPLPDEQLARKIVEECKDRPGIVWEHAARCETSSVTVQMALEMVVRDQQSDEAQAITHAMCGHVLQACESRCANFVLSKIFAVMPTCLVSCLVEELRGRAVWAATYRFGYRCIMSLVKHHATSVNDAVSDAVSEVMHQLRKEASSLRRHQYGKHVYRALEDCGLLFDGSHAVMPSKTR